MLQNFQTGYISGLWDMDLQLNNTSGRRLPQFTTLYRKGLLQSQFRLRNAVGHD